MGFSSRKIATGLLVTALFVPGLVSAFSDLKMQDWQYKSVKYLTEKGVVNGYSDGTFKPNKKVNRAEALKLILVATEKDLASSATVSFEDVPGDSWFQPHVKYAVASGIVSGDAGTNRFAPARDVNKAEFVKMLLKSFDVNPDQYDFSDVTINDVNDSDWFAPYMKFAVKFLVVTPDENGNVNPSKALNRGETAQIVFNILLSGRGLDPQVLLNIVENKLIAAIEGLEQADWFAASSNAAIGYNFAEITLGLLPDNNIVQAAEKTATAVKNLVGAYSAGQNGLVDDIIDTSKEAWAAADESMALNPEQSTIATEIKRFAESLAARARERKAEIEAEGAVQ